METTINHIKKTLDRIGGTSSIYLGALTEMQIKKLREYFEIEKDFMGYWKFRMKI